MFIHTVQCNITYCKDGNCSESVKEIISWFYTSICSSDFIIEVLNIKAKLPLHTHLTVAFLRPRIRKNLSYNDKISLKFTI